jgi:homoserine kinase
MPSHITEATAFAPASVGNVAVGFDIMGLALDGAGDHVTVRRVAQPGVRLIATRGVAGALPADPRANCATAGLIALIDALGLAWGVEVEVDKGIAMGSGMGGSAASAAGAVVAMSALLDQPLSNADLLRFALVGEQVASGSAHADNLAPCLFGGLQLVMGRDPVRTRRLPTPAGLVCVLVHPHMSLETRRARAALERPWTLAEFVAQSERLAGFITACHQGDPGLLAQSLEDVLVEPHRAPLIPGFEAVKRAALDAGALGASISGAGPSVFAWCEAAHAEAARDAMRAAFGDAGLDSDCLISPLDAPGARVVATR